ncbi:MAG: SAP domain-containing protein [Pseudomonadota bacterium]
MNMKEIRIVAKQRGIKSGKLTKLALIRLVQKGEGNNECYASTQSSTCGQVSCLWREDCSKADK